jgi:hypothetical protein
LASLIIEECKSQESDTYFFYCSKDQPQQMTSLAVFRGLLRQVIHRYKDLIPLCYDKRKENGGSILTNPDTAKTLLATVFERNARQFVVIDGLDECLGPEVKPVLAFLTQQVERSDAYEPGKLRVLLTSLYMNEIKKQLGGSSIMEIEERDNAADIEVFVKAEIKRMRHNLEPQTQRDIIDMTCRNSHGGSFLLALIKAV